MVKLPTVDKAWVLAEFLKLYEAEDSLASEMKQRADSPPDPSLAVLYHEIAEGDAQHLVALETIATRYGHTPNRSEKGGVGATLGRLKDKLADMGTAASAQVGQNLQGKANALHWARAWSHTFQAIGDAESASALDALAGEDQTHHDALQGGLNRMLEQEARAKEA